jgi:hypothetical protein
MNLENLKQNDIGLVAKYAGETGDVRLACVLGGATKAFYIRQGTIREKDRLRAEVTDIIAMIRRNKAEHRDTSRLKGELAATERIYQRIESMLHCPRAEALTSRDRRQLNGALTQADKRWTDGDQARPLGGS